MAVTELEPDWKFACLTALQQLHEALDVIEAIGSEGRLPFQLKNRIDEVLAPRLANKQR